MRMEAARVGASIVWHCLEATVAPANDRAAIVGEALERIFQLLRDQIDHHLPPCTAIVWEEQRSPNSKSLLQEGLRGSEVVPLVVQAAQSTIRIPQR